VRAYAIIALVIASASAGGCYNAKMDPGTRCGSCHGGHAKSFGAAGTIYASAHPDAPEGIEGARIDVTDAKGNHVTMMSNSVGNFVVTRRLEPPYRVMVTRGEAVAVMTTAPNGDCNSCHTATGSPGRIHIP
jgi:hypothetical protein